MAASVLHLKTQSLSSKSKRRKSRETTISTFATPSIIPNSPDSFIENLTHIGKSDTPAIVTPEKALCLAPSKPFTSPQTSQREEKLRTNPRISDPESELISFTVTVNSSSSSPSQSPSQSPTSLKLIASPTMDSSYGNGVNGGSSFGYYPSNYSKFNSALNAGLLIPLSPPSSLDKTRSSPTLSEMMANEEDCLSRNQISTNNVPISSAKPQISVLDKQALLQHRVSEILGNCSPGNQFNDSKSSDVKLTLSSKDGIRVTINVHRQILVTHSKFFAAKLSDRRSWPQRSLPHILEIPDCDDIEIYIETLRLMYCKDLRRKLMKEDVSKVLEILKVSASIVFEAGVSSCLEYLEATPWTEDEEEKVAYLLSQLNLEEARAGEVLKRVLMEESRGEEGNNNEEVLIKLLHVVLEGKDEKARREMKSLILKMLRENSCQSDLSKESLYSACDGCLQLLHLHFLQAAELKFQDVGQIPRQPLQDVGQIARQADNLHWILDILIDRQIAEDFLKTWVNQSELSEIHSKVPAIHRFEVSRVTARLFVGIGKGKILACKEVRYLLLRTWLRPFYDDFAWMKRASKGLDRHLIEEGLSNTILTLPLAWQQEIFLSWFRRFLNSAEDCPNIQRGFEVWWRRAFWRRKDEPDMARKLRIVSATCENS